MANTSVHAQSRPSLYLDLKGELRAARRLILVKLLSHNRRNRQDACSLMRSYRAPPPGIVP